MATSGSFDFVVDRDSIITEALQQVGKLGDHESPTSDQLTSCSRTLNLLIKAWQADGLRLWLRKEYSFTPTSGTESYTFGSGGTGGSERFLEIVQAWREDSDGVKTPLRIISQNEYNELSDPDQTGTPTSVHYDPQLSLGTLYVWPTGESSNISNIHLIGRRPLYDFDAASDDADVPQEWYMALMFHLAWAVSGKYGVSKRQAGEIKEKAIYWYNMAQDYDVEHGTSIHFSPEMR